jgi:hypothetical protein
MLISDKEIIDRLKIKSPDKVLDIGGSMKQHEEIEVDTLVDIISPNEAPYTRSKLKAKKFVKVDICREKLPFKDKSFDICLCTHTLEDLYNPFLVMDEMGRVAKRGIIVTPSMGKDMVFSHIDITDWLTGPRRTPGLSHHKWFFVGKEGKVLVAPKNYGVLFSEGFQVTDWKGEDEFIYDWKNNLKYEVFPDINIHKLIDFYDEYVEGNKDKFKFGKVLKYSDSAKYTLKAYLKWWLKRGRGFSYRGGN